MVISLPLAGCLFRSSAGGRRQISTAPLKSATQADLINRTSIPGRQESNFAGHGRHRHSAVGGVKKGKSPIPADPGLYSGAQASMLDDRCLMPIVRNHAFDMVSDGRDFKLWILQETVLLSAATTSKPTISNSRWRIFGPRHIRRADSARDRSADEIAVMENSFET